MSTPLRASQADRLVTVSLTQALATQSFSTGSEHLDDALEGGLKTGQITEIYGPPGSGKSLFGLHLTYHATREGSIIWFECSQPFPGARLRDLLEPDDDERGTFEKVTCIKTYSLVSLISLLSSEILGDDTKLIVIDDLSTLITSSFPPSRNPEGLKKSRAIKTITALLSTIASRNLVVVVLNKLSTKVYPTGAILESSLGDHWSSHCGTRIVLYRTPDRVLAIQKSGGRNLQVPKKLEFVITPAGLEIRESNKRVRRDVDHD